ncbi:eukaryotic translation initiation factor 5a [Anaeramoeba flamelloides]|uniref:Eukaryotic translation initiation factor 5a n=1 Tax=Anaeramoeba flamelloides TaxID=1746091 RepID=A0ABQ8Z7M2_9EUKA|nr:eukaryotic translation initiation factor 5a [Anaeramoeba flamelloides]
MTLYGVYQKQRKKIRFQAHDIFTLEQVEDLIPFLYNLQEPKLTEVRYGVIDVQDQTVTLMELDGDYETIDLTQQNEELCRGLQKHLKEKKDLIATVTSSMGQSHITHYEEEN